MHHGLIVASLAAEIRRVCWIAGARAGANGMAFGFTATRSMRLAAALLVVCWVSGDACRGGEDAGAAAATCGDAVAVSLGPERWSRAWRRRGSALSGRATSPAAGFHHHADAGAARPHAQLHRHCRLDPSVQRQGRAAGRYRLYLLPARRRRSRKPAGDVSVQWRPGRVLGLAAVRRGRAVAVVDRRRWRGIFRDA